MNQLRRTYRENKHTMRLILIMALWMVFMALTKPAKFYTFDNFQTIVSQFPEFGLMSLGVMLCMMTGGIDLSCVGVANFTSILSAMWMVKLGGEAGVLSAGYFPLIFLFAIVVGGLCGAFSGFLVAKIRIPPILATLGVNELLTGVCIAMTGGSAISNFPKELTNFISTNLGGVVPVRLLFFVAAALLVWFMMSKTTYGTKLHLLGTSEKVAYYSGMKTGRLLVRTYMTSGIFAALGGMMMLGTYASARADYGAQYTLQTILIVVLGGVSPNGGKGKLSGVVLAMLLLKMLESGINRFPNISSYYISLIWGGVLIVAMLLDSDAMTRRRRKTKA